MNFAKSRWNSRLELRSWPVLLSSRFARPAELFQAIHPSTDEHSTRCNATGWTAAADRHRHTENVGSTCYLHRQARVACGTSSGNGAFSEREPRGANEEWDGVIRMGAVEVGDRRHRWAVRCRRS